MNDNSSMPSCTGKMEGGPIRRRRGEKGRGGEKGGGGEREGRCLIWRV